MHSSRMRTARSLTVSRRFLHMPPLPPGKTMHTPPGVTTHGPPLGATTHAPLEKLCTPPQKNHRCPSGATMHCNNTSHHFQETGWLRFIQDFTYEVILKVYRSVRVLRHTVCGHMIQHPPF